MKKRIGNDIQFTWHIYRKDGDTQTPESFAGKEVEVKLISPLQRTVTIEDVSIATGVVTFTFRGKHQVTLGNYVAILQENRGEDGMVTLDVVNAVTLVPHSYMEEDGDEGDVIEASSVELESSISAGSGGGIEQQQADWAQTDDTAVDFIKNKPDLDLYCRKDADNTHSDSSDTYVKRVYYEQGGLRQLDRVTVGGDSIKFFHSLRGKEAKELSLQLDDVEKLKDLPTNAELSEVATSGSYNDLSDKPDLSGFITNSVNNLVNYYLKSETYTKTEVQQLIGAIQQFHYEVYPTLPQTGASNVLYLIGPTGTGADKYEEYVYANNDWTKIGDTSIDLSGYVTTQALTTALADYVTSSALSTTLANYYNKNDVDGLLAGKADKNEMSVVTGTGANAGKTTITLKQGTSATVLTAHQDISGKEDVTNIVAPINATDETLPITTLACEVGKYYRIDVAVDTIGITLPAINSTVVKTIVVYLTAGTTPAITISSSDSKDVYYQDGFEIEAGNIYEINALFNGAAWIVAAVKINVE